MLIAVLAVVASASARDAGAGSAATPIGGGTLRYDDSLVTCADPQQEGDNPASYQLKPLLGTLLAQEPSGKFVPWLATAYTTNANATQFTFTIRKGVTFSDGTSLTPKVVGDNFTAIVHKLGADAPLAESYLTNYSGYKVLPGNKLEVLFSKPNIAFLQGSATGNLTIVSEATTQESQSERCAKGVVAAGPFVISQWVPGTTLDYLPRSGYSWGDPIGTNKGEPYLAAIDMANVNDTSVLANSLLSGQINAYSVVLPQDATRIQEAGGKLYTTTNGGYPVVIIPNLKNTVFSDPAVREAVQIGFDRKTAIQGAIGNWFEPATSALSPTTQGYVNLSSDLQYNPKKAEQLLQSDGWTVGKGGIRYKDGKPLEFNVTWEYDWNNTSEVLSVIKQQLAQIGVDLEINLVPTGTSAAIYASGNYGSRWSNGYTPEPNTLNAILNVAQGNYNGRTAPIQLDTLLNEQLETSNVAKRDQLLAQIQKIIIQQGYLIPVYNWAQSMAVSSDVQGVTLPFLSGPGPLYEDIWISK